MALKVHEFIIRSELGSQPKGSKPTAEPASAGYQPNVNTLQESIKSTFLDIAAELLSEQQER
jgi:hypothetical protein